MRRRSSMLIASPLVLATGSTALAAVTPKPHTDYFFLASGSFSITLNTKGPMQLTGSQALPMGATRPSTGVLLVCPASVAGGPLAELHVGFPGARLKLQGKYYGFTRSYTENNAKLVVLSTGATSTVRSVKVRVTGTVATAKLITGTVSVQAPGCSLKPSKFRAQPFSEHFR
jgi:hypothetical protein